MPNDLARQLEQVLDAPVTSMTRLSGGCIAQVYRVESRVCGTVVAKFDPAGNLESEAWMLEYLSSKSSLPVPQVIASTPNILVLNFIESGDAMTDSAEVHAAGLLARLHNITDPCAGLERDTRIGSLPQPNPRTSSWIEFFARHRLVFMADQAMNAGRISATTRAKIHALAGRLDRFIDEPRDPTGHRACSLLHGDVWGGNVLVAPDGESIAAFLDPAISFGHPEAELAFITLFSTFSKPFFDAYLRARDGLWLDPDGFWALRRDVYNLYPLLVHARLFGGAYASQVCATLTRIDAPGINRFTR